jgi:hypothetical protein
MDYLDKNLLKGSSTYSSHLNRSQKKKLRANTYFENLNNRFQEENRRRLYDRFMNVDFECQQLIDAGSISKPVSMNLPMVDDSEYLECVTQLMNIDYSCSFCYNEHFVYRPLENDKRPNIHPPCVTRSHDDSHSSLICKDTNDYQFGYGLLNGIVKFFDVATRKHNWQYIGTKVFDALITVFIQCEHRTKCHGCSDDYLHNYVRPFDHLICQFSYGQEINRREFLSTLKFMKLKIIHDSLSTMGNARYSVEYFDDLDNINCLYRSYQHNYLQCVRAFKRLRISDYYSNFVNYVVRINRSQKSYLFLLEYRDGNNYFIGNNHDYPIAWSSYLWKYYFYSTPSILATTYRKNFCMRGKGYCKYAIKFSRFKMSKFITRKLDWCFV